MAAFDFSLVDAPFRMQPGLRRIAADAPQLTPSLANSRHLREKMAVLASFADEALCSIDGFDPLPALRAIAREAACHAGDGHGVAFAIDDLANASAPRLGWAIRSGRPHGDGDLAIGELLHALPASRRCIALLCLAFAEDFAVIDGGTTTIPWLAVCLPSRWAPESKAGKAFAEVHAPVADGARVVAAAPSLARLVTGDARWERFVWTISAESRLHQHPARGEVAWPARDARRTLADDADALVAGAAFRHERQTFIPVAKTGTAVFTIRVDSQPFAEAVITADAAARLHAALASMSPAVLAYKNLDAARDRLLDWLWRRAGSSTLDLT